MSKNKLFILVAIVALVVAALACSGSVSTAKITSAKMSADSEGTSATTTFSPELPDLKLFFAIAAALLKAGGIVFIHEQHPFAELFPTGGHPDAGALRIIEPYFKTGPYVEPGCLDYLGNVKYASVTTEYWFMHTLSEIIMGLVENGIAIEKFLEYEKAISPHHYPLEAQHAGLPLSYILIGRK